MGIMGHRVVIVRGNCLRLNLSVTAPYNADFDGDEMNLHVPQSLAARANVMQIMQVSSQILSPQANRPCMGIVQDSLVGAYRLTRACELFTQHQAAHIMGHTRYVRAARLPPPAVVHRGTALWTGKQLFSMLLPVALFMDRESCTKPALEECTPDESLVIVGGQILSGQLTKAVLGTSSGGIIDVVCRDEGGAACARLLSDAQRLVTAYNEMRASASASATVCSATAASSR